MRSLTCATNVRPANLTNCYRRKHVLIFGTSLVGTLLFKLIDYIPDDEEEQGSAKVPAEKPRRDFVKGIREKIKKESDGWRQKTSREKAGEADLGQEKSRGGTKGVNEDEGEAKVNDEADDEYEEAENEDEEQDEEDDDDDDDEEEEEEDDEGEEGSIPEAIPEDALFIPLGLIRQRRPAFYKGSDPEWQSFVEFSRDRNRAQLVRSKYAFLA